MLGDVSRDTSLIIEHDDETVYLSKRRLTLKISGPRHDKYSYEKG